MEQLDLVSALRVHFGFPTFRPGQCQAIQHALARHDALVVMPTGSGKSLCYQLPALILDGTTVVVSPLIALMKDQVDALTATSKRATFINSTLASKEQRERLAGLARGDYKIVYVAPERLRNTDFLRAIRGTRIALLAVDEAHCISQWGHDFRPDYMHLREFIPKVGQPSVLALTATATPEVQSDIVKQLGVADAERIVTGFNRPNLRLSVCYAPGEADKLRKLESLLCNQSSGIIYTGTRREAEEVAEFVNTATRVSAVYYHAGLDDSERTRAQDMFMSGKISVIVATNAFGMGVDKPDIRWVVHYSLPSTVEAYYQEVGRAGRDGKSARGILLYSPEDRALQEWFIENDAPNSKQTLALYRALPRGVTRVSPFDLQREIGLGDTRLRLALRQLEIAGAVQRLGDERGAMILQVENLAHLDLAAGEAEIERFRNLKRRKLSQMIRYAETNACRRRFILDYFGDRGPADAPDCCDNHVESVIQPARRAESKEQWVPLVILETVRTLKRPLGREKIAMLLRGSQARKILDWGHQRHRFYGKLKHLALREIGAVIEKLVEHGYLKTIGGKYPVVALTPLGTTAVKTRAAIALNEPQTRCSAKDASGAGARGTLQDSVAQFLTHPHPRLLHGPWRVGFALDFNSKFVGAQHTDTELGRLLHAFKYKGERNCADILVARLADFLGTHAEIHANLIIPIPSTKKARPYDPVPLLTQALSKAIGVPVIETALVKTRATRLQKEMTNLAQKQANVRGAFGISDGDAVRGKCVLLVDDFYDSGMTLAEATRVLYAASAADVCVLTVTKTIHAD